MVTEVSQRIGDFRENLCCGRIGASSGLGPESPVKLPFVVATAAPLMGLEHSSPLEVGSLTPRLRLCTNSFIPGNISQGRNQSINKYLLSS